MTTALVSLKQSSFTLWVLIRTMIWRVSYFSISVAAVLLFSWALSLSVRMHAVDSGFAIEAAGGCDDASVDDEDISSSAR